MKTQSSTFQTALASIVGLALTTGAIGAAGSNGFGAGNRPNSERPQYDETRIRQASQNSTVQGSPWQLMHFTVTGYANDRVTSMFLNGTLASLASSPYVRDIVQHSGGQTSLRFAIPANPGWSGSTINLLTSHNFLIDSDRVIVR